MYPHPYQFIEEDPYIIFENPIYITHNRPTTTNHAFEETYPKYSWVSLRCVVIWFFILLLIVLLTLYLTHKL